VDNIELTSILLARVAYYLGFVNIAVLAIEKGVKTR
jgi:hypothetical protein